VLRTFELLWYCTGVGSPRRYGVFASNSSTFLYWEKLRDEAESTAPTPTANSAGGGVGSEQIGAAGGAGLGAPLGRRLAVTGRSATVEDVFGEVRRPCVCYGAAAVARRRRCGGGCIC